jgi:PKD domain/Bacterial Ig-like domain (group 1)
MLSIITGLGRTRNLRVWACAATAAIVTTACDSMPLLAPRESTITLSTSSAVVQANGTTEIRATVLEASGTPVHNGTTVTFTTNLGAISPTDARTENGVAVVRFVANGQSGTAAIKAISGGATSEALTLTVGAAAANAVSLNANPTRVSATGGPSVITATVVDTSGNPIQGVAVTFSSTAGSLSATSANTDLSGLATTTLTTNREATVTASVAGKTATVVVGVATRPTVTVSVSADPTVGGPTTFTIGVTPAAGGVPIERVVINYGDRRSTNLGPVSGTGITVQHVYEDHDTYTVTVTATDVAGESASASTVIVVQPVVILTIDASRKGNNVTFTATVSPSDTVIASYRWTFGDGQSATTSTPQITHAYDVPGIYNVTVEATTLTNRRASASTTVNIPTP